MNFDANLFLHVMKHIVIDKNKFLHNCFYIMCSKKLNENIRIWFLYLSFKKIYVRFEVYIL
jgi:hypothetical protein